MLKYGKNKGDTQGKRMLFVQENRAYEKLISWNRNKLCYLGLP
jgi:hypothetical protein